MAGALQLLARAAGKQSRRAATALAPRARARAATFLAPPPPLERPTLIAAAILPTSRVMAPTTTLQRFSPAGSDDRHVRVRASEADADTVADDGAAPKHPSRLAHATTGAKGGGFPFAVGHRDPHEPGGAEGRRDCGFLVVVGDAALTFNAGGMLCLCVVGDAALAPLERRPTAAVLPAPRASISQPRVMAPTLLRFLHAGCNVRAREADTVAAGAAPNRSRLALAIPTATGVKSAGFPFTLGHRDAREPGARLPGGAEGVDDAAPALNFNCAYGAMLCVGDAALGPRRVAFLAPPLERPVPAAAAILSGSAALVLPQLFVAARNQARVGAKQASSIRTTVGDGDCAFVAVSDDNSTHNGGAGAILCVQAERPLAAALGRAQRKFACPDDLYALAPLRRRSASRLAAGVLGGLNFNWLLVATTGRRGYSSTAGGTDKSGGEDDGKRRPKLQQSKLVLAKLSTLYFHVRRIETVAFLHAKFSLLHSKFSLLHRHEMKVKSEKLSKQIRLLPLWIFGAILLGIAFTCYLVVEVVVPRVADVAFHEFIKLATQLKDLANEVDEEKVKRMAKDLSKVITNTIVDCVGGRVKEKIVDSLKFWRWGKKPKA